MQKYGKLYFLRLLITSQNELLPNLFCITKKQYVYIKIHGFHDLAHKRHEYLI